MLQVPRKGTRRVLTYGRFDDWCLDHVRFLQHLSTLGDAVIVGCTTDAYAARQGRPCVTSYAERRALLERCRYVDQVIPETDPEQKRTDIVNYDASLLVMGIEEAGTLAHMQDIAQVLFLPRRKNSDIPTPSARLLAI